MRKRLESYKSMQEEIRELRHKLEHLYGSESLIANDTILDYRSGYPVPQSVVGYDFDKEYRLAARYRNRISRLEKECAETEEFVEAIPDSLTRRIFRMHYLEGRSQKDIAKAVHLDRSTVGKKICRFFSLRSGYIDSLQTFH